MPPRTTSEDLTRYVGAFGIAEASIHDGRGQEDIHPAQQVGSATARHTTLMEEEDLLDATTEPANVSATTPPSEEDPGQSTPEECRQQAAGVLNEIRAMVATEIQTWERHRASCRILLEQGAAGVWSEECSELEKDVLQEFENLRKRVELCFNDVRVKTEGKLLSPQEQLIAELLDKNQKLESRLKEKEEEQEGILNTELARTNDELAMVKEDLEGQKTKIAVLEKELLGAVAKDVGGTFAFGASAWNRYFGNVGEEPPLPGNIADLLESPCPFWSGQQIRETHLLVLIPSTVNGRPFSLDLLGILMQNPTAGGNRAAYGHYHPTVKSIIGKKSVEQSYWILITREILPDSKSKTYEAQEALIDIQTYRRTDMDYKVSSALEAATAILTCYLRLGEILVGSGSWARCNDRIGGFQALVGHFDGTRGLQLCYGRRGASSKQGVLGCCEWK